MTTCLLLGTPPPRARTITEVDYYVETRFATICFWRRQPGIWSVSPSTWRRYRRIVADSTNNHVILRLLVSQLKHTSPRGGKNDLITQSNHYVFAHTGDAERRFNETLGQWTYQISKPSGPLPGHYLSQSAGISRDWVPPSGSTPAGMHGHGHSKSSSWASPSHR